MKSMLWVILVYDKCMRMEETQREREFKDTPDLKRYCQMAADLIDTSDYHRNFYSRLSEDRLASAGREM